MPVMKGDVIVGPSWINARARINAADTTQLIIQNKGMYPVLAFASEIKPEDAARDGYRILPNAIWTVSANTTPAWLKTEGGTSNLCIQEVDE